jgi:4'-phosphopantetheinyl transferase
MRSSAACAVSSNCEGDDVSGDRAGTVRWLQRREGDVPLGDEWLSERELAVHSRLVIPPRRADWRLGRWTAKAALAHVLGVDPSRVSVLAAADGAPEPYLDGQPIARSLSITHRSGLALAVVGDGVVVGGDLEVVEPRSSAFVREWFGDGEQQQVAAAGETGSQHELACLLWSAKEATAKVLREGLRLDPRGATVTLVDDREPGEPAGHWQQFSVDWGNQGAVVEGWWRLDGSFVRTIAAAPTCPVPVAAE